jgi:hypothetical protein
MEFAIPISRFDPSHVRWGQTRVGPFRKTVPFGYEESSINFNSLILVLEPLRVVQIDWERNQLVLEETGDKPFLAKLEQFQKTVNSYLLKNAKEWLEGSHNTEIYALQPWLKSRRLTLYLSSEPASLPFYIEGSKATFSEKSVKPGDFIRAVVKLYGISLQTTNQDVWTGKSRIQHHVLELYKVSSDLLEQ